MIRKFLILICAFTCFSCFAQKEAIGEPQNPHFSYKFIGGKKIGNILYQSIFTENNISDSCKEHMKRLSKVSQRRNWILLFYNKIESTPADFQLEDKKLTINSSLIGGLEIYEGRCYRLGVKNK